MLGKAAAKLFSASALALCTLSTPSVAQDCPIKVGILHSLTGTMALSEKPLKDTVELLVKKQNEKGGVAGCQLETVVVDPASDDATFAAKARELLTDKQVDVIFGNWTSSSRKAVLPVVEELNGLLFYPVQFEGEESSKNVFYTGAAPNQQAIPAADYMMDELEVDFFYLIGTDYVYPQTTNGILQSYLVSKGIPAEQIKTIYTPFGHKDWDEIVSEIVEAGDGEHYVGVISTVNGDANIEFYNSLARHGVEASDIPVMAFSIGETELQTLDTEQLAGHYAAWNYFQSAESPENEEWVATWKAAMGPDSVTNDPIEAHYIGFNMWVNAVEKAGTADVDAVRTAMYGQEVHNLTGGMAVMQPNHMISKPVLIGEIDTDGQFYIVSKQDLVEGDAWSDHLPASAKLKSDWVELNCGKYDTEAGACVSQ